MKKNLSKLLLLSLTTLAISSIDSVNAMEKFNRNKNTFGKKSMINSYDLQETTPYEDENNLSKISKADKWHKEVFAQAASECGAENVTNGLMVKLLEEKLEALQGDNYDRKNSDWLKLLTIKNKLSKKPQGEAYNDPVTSNQINMEKQKGQIKSNNGLDYNMRINALRKDLNSSNNAQYNFVSKNETEDDKYSHAEDEIKPSNDKFDDELINNLYFEKNEKTEEGIIMRLLLSRDERLSTKRLAGKINDVFRLSIVLTERLLMENQDLRNTVAARDKQIQGLQAQIQSLQSFLDNQGQGAKENNIAKKDEINAQVEKNENKQKNVLNNIPNNEIKMSQGMSSSQNPNINNNNINNKMINEELYYQQMLNRGNNQMGSRQTFKNQMNNQINNQMLQKQMYQNQMSQNPMNNPMLQKQMYQNPMYQNQMYQNPMSQNPMYKFNSNNFTGTPGFNLNLSGSYQMPPYTNTPNPNQDETTPYDDKNNLSKISKADKWYNEVFVQAASECGAENVTNGLMVKLLEEKLEALQGDNYDRKNSDWLKLLTIKNKLSKKSPSALLSAQ